MWIPVLKCLNGEKLYRKQMISCDDLITVRCRGKLLVFTSITGDQYHLTGMLEEWKILLKDEGFFGVDRGCLANMNKAEYVDHHLRLLYFPSGQHCTISVKALKKIKNNYPCVIFI